MGSHNGISSADLAQFTGTLNWFRHPLASNVVYTDGIRYVAERAGAYWLIDEIALVQGSDAALDGEEFQAWTLIVDDTVAVLRCDDGNGRVLLEKKIDYTDFPEPGIKLYFTDGVIMLPGEY